MRSLSLLVLTLALVACAAPGDGDVIELAPDGKADGATTASLVLSADTPSQRVRITCAETWNCDVRLRAAYAPDIWQLTGYPDDTFFGVDVIVYKFGEKIWEEGTVMARSEGTTVTENHLIETNHTYHWLNDQDELELKGPASAIFEVEFRLNQSGLRELEDNAQDRHDLTVDVAAHWW